jgi:WD40 repeat protein
MGNRDVIVSGSRDRTIKVWDSDSGACVTTTARGETPNEVLMILGDTVSENGRFRVEHEGNRVHIYKKVGEYTTIDILI